MKREYYPTDLTDKQWALLEPVIPPAKPGGRPRESDMREVINAILYQLRTGCQWRMLPHDFPPWSTVWTYFRTWRDSGEWERIEGTLRKVARANQRREATPRAALIDDQSMKMMEREGSNSTMVLKKSKGAGIIY